MGVIKSLKCRECFTEYEPTLKYVCDECFGPLDVIYNYDTVNLTKDKFNTKPRTLWRYFELLPIFKPSYIIDIAAGFTPLTKCEKLNKVLGLKQLYVKNDTLNPTYSFKDRPASVGVSKALELGITSVGCASTGNLAAATSACAAKGGLKCYVFIPRGIERAKITQASAYGAHIIEVDGDYDDANRLASQAADVFNIGIVNINLRPYYVEGSKTLAFEIAEQMNWSLPDYIIIPIGSGALLHSICKGFEELERIGLIDNFHTKVIGAQPEGCSPVVKAFKSGSEEIIPIEHPNTIAKSLAIGEPGDGLYALRKIKKQNGYAESVTDLEILEAIRLLAKTEGIFAEPAGGVTIAVLKKLVEQGKISKDESIVCCVTGSGLKSLEIISTPILQTVKPNVESLAKVIGV
ncbi:MAG: threonine synthase [Nitrososphaerota archaeon]|nr:threonine synthase [Nitrososphaerota archaeon]